MDFKMDAKNNYIQPLLKHIIPFKFDVTDDSNFTTWDEIDSIVKAYSNRDKLQELKVSDTELFTHLMNQINFNATASTENTKQQTQIPKEHIIGSHIARELKEVHFEFEPENSSFNNNEILKQAVQKAKIAIPDYQLFLFKSGIGFLTITLELEGMDNVEAYIELNNYLKSINRLNQKSGTKICKKMNKATTLESNEFTIDTEKPNYDIHCYNVMGKNKKLWLRNDLGISSNDIKVIYREKNDSYEVVENILQKLSYGEFILSLLEPIKRICFFNEYMEALPAKALVFSSAVIHKEEQDSDKNVIKNLLRISRGYNHKYELKVNEASDNEAKEQQNGIYIPFDNVYWAYSREGIGNVIIDEENHKASEFLITDFEQRLDRSYLLLYILSLHQYYGLIYLSDQASKLPFSVDCYSNIDDQECNNNFKMLKVLREKVYFFHLKCVFEEVSYITHQSCFYKGIISVLGVKNMILELDFEMKKVSEIAKLVRDEETYRQDNEKKQRELDRNALEKKRMEQEIERNKLEEKRESEKKMLLDLMASGGGLLGLFVLYDKIAKVVKNLNLLNIFKMHWFKQEQLNEFLLTMLIVLVMGLIGFSVFKIKKALKKRKQKGAK